MDHALLQRVDASLICIFLFIGMLIMVILGRLSGELWANEDSAPKGGVETLLRTMYALFGFVLAFTFGMSGTHYQNVRNAILQEAAQVSNAITQADLFPDTVRDDFRKDFKNYLEACIAFYDHPTDADLIPNINQQASKAASRLWARAVQQSKLPHTPCATNSMISALNNMFATATTRKVLMNSRVPDPIVYMLLISALTMSFLGGITSSTFHRRDYIVVIGFVLLAVTIVYLILDLGRPTTGLIQVKEAQQAIIDLRTKL